MQVTKYALRRESTLAVKPRANVIRSPKHKFPHKKDICVTAVSSLYQETSMIPVGYQ